MKTHQRKTLLQTQQASRSILIQRCVAVASLIATCASVGSAQVEVPTGLAPAGVFSAEPTAGAFTTVATPQRRFIESGAGFLWFGEDLSGGPAVGFNQLLAVPENESREDYDFAAFFAQDGIGIFDPLDDGFTMEFTRWATDPPTEEKPEETVLIFAKLFDLAGEQLDFNNDGVLNVDDDTTA